MDIPMKLSGFSIVTFVAMKSVYYFFMAFKFCQFSLKNTLLMQLNENYLIAARSDS